MSGDPLKHPNWTGDAVISGLGALAVATHRVATATHDVAGAKREGTRSKERERATDRKRADLSFPSIQVSRTGAWIQEQAVRMRREFDAHLAMLRDQQRTYAESHARRPDARKRRSCEGYAAAIYEFQTRAEPTLDAVEQLAAQVAPEDSFRLSAKELEIFSTRLG